MALYVGIDIGTSGCRATAINHSKEVIAESSVVIPEPVSKHAGWSEQDPDIWWNALIQVLQSLLLNIPGNDVCAISIDGTSSTLLVCDKNGRPLDNALMYNDTRSLDAAKTISLHAPANSIVHGPGSSLSKCLHLLNQHKEASYVLHQSDWLLGKLSGHFGISDENNCLKLGFTPDNSSWPSWLKAFNLFNARLPQVYPPGTAVASIDKAIAKQLSLPAKTRIVTGTTDSTAAFIATGASKPGEAVTSLGSTLVTKVIADMPIVSTKHGVYSHKVLGQWLCGGASNSGGAALLTFFSIEEMQALTPLLTPEQETGLDFYPLPSIGERFPIADPDYQPRLPVHVPTDMASRAIIFQGLLEGISRIEAQAYSLLQTLGAPYPEKVISVGGGSTNTAWNKIRQKYLGVPVVQADHSQASYGTALLAWQGYTGSMSNQ